VGMIVHKYGYGISFNRSPFILLSSMLFLVSFQVLITGLLAEILMRIYHESQEKPVYYVREVMNAERTSLAAPPIPRPSRPPAPPKRASIPPPLPLRDQLKARK
jgi:hypothetical protein